MNIKTVTLVGANGSMGAGCAGVIAAFGGCKVHMLARDMDKAKEGVQKAISSIKSSVIESNLIPGTYDADLEKAISESDWVFEAVAETYDVKEPMKRRISAARKSGSLISTVSSGLSIARLARAFDGDGVKHYYGTHFFNPPYKLTLCELVTHPGNDPGYTQELTEYLTKVLRRQVVITNDTPGFAGNRIGFQLMNEAAIFAEKHQDKGGIYFMDSLLSGYTGRAMSPLATIDLVGLDVHKAIVNNISEQTEDVAHDTFTMPEFMLELISTGALGDKAKKGFYRREKTPDGKTLKKVYNIKTGEYEALPVVEIPFKKDMITAIQNSNYRKAAEILKQAPGMEAELLRYFIARYISYSFVLVPEVTDQDGIDGAMGFGFSWVPPSAWVDILGGLDETRKFIEKAKLEVPPALAKASASPFYRLQNRLDYRQLFRAG